MLSKNLPRVSQSASHYGKLLNIRSSGNKRYTFETSHQMLTSIDTTRLTPVAHCCLFTVNPCCSLFSVYSSILLIVECMKWGMHVMLKTNVSVI